MPQTAAKDRILDDFGTPIVYMPANVVVNNTSTVVVQEGYFWSAGPNQILGDADDIRSTEAN